MSFFSPGKYTNIVLLHTTLLANLRAILLYVTTLYLYNNWSVQYYPYPYMYICSIKGWLSPKINISLLFTYPHVIRDVYVLLFKRKRKLGKTFLDFSPYNAIQRLKTLHWRSKIQMAIPYLNWQTGVFPSETITYFMKI